MLSFLSDTAAALSASARARRVLAGRALALAEADAPRSDPDEHAWRPTGPAAFFAPGRRTPTADELRDDARRLARENPYARNALRLLESYVAGPGLAMTVRGDERLADRATALWAEFLAAAEGHWSFAEHAARTWRDGEAIVRRYAPDGWDAEDAAAWPPQVRFVEPAAVRETPAHPGCEGVLTREGDVEEPLAYLVHDARGRVDQVPADEVFHSRRGVDSNARRGRSLLEPCVAPLRQHERWVETELKARKLQASIVLWRKVHGGPPPSDERGERFAPGTILTTSPTTDLQFLQPRTNLSDAVPLGRMLLLAAAAGAGLPEFMFTADASNANFASTMAAEGPAVKRFQSEQRRLAGELTRFWRWVMSASPLSADELSRLRVEWTFPELVARDRPAERAADVRLLKAGVLSRAEIARRDGVDLAAMEAES